MSKIIKVESCAGCDKKTKLSDGWYCKHLPSSVPIIDKYIEEYISTKTIHPDCPLDDMEDKSALKMTNEILAIENKLLKSKVRDATKHIRAVHDWKPIINPYDFDMNELAILHNGLLEAIKADVKD